MYVLVPSAFVAYLAVGTVFVASILYLWRGREVYDHVAHSAGELAALFTALAGQGERGEESGPVAGAARDVAVNLPAAPQGEDAGGRGTRGSSPRPSSF